MADGKSPLRTVRHKCLDCCCGSRKVVKYCPADGVHSTRCALWPFRFGARPATAARRHGERFLDPEAMPDANVPVQLA